ncbi:MAG: F0F1 ATP synthase subunit B [Rhodospirillales bacterium]|jgi:F-type H+-transporting ATPase subunit b|nr:F0F1 ATP synthase subunit B [Rhodospirillales bacterium]MDP6882724.1 F0F1 ATP synthase subunit B [Rhodospirillales bacterium]
MSAWAAETAAAHGEPFYATAEFWVMVAFVILVAFAFKPLFRIAVTALDARAETIKHQIDEAARLREEAQGLLATYQRKQRDAMKETGDILDQARDEAARQASRAEEAVEASLKRRERTALERIAQAEARSLEAVRGLAVDIAVDATRRVLAETVTDKKAHALVAEAIKELPKKLN